MVDTRSQARSSIPEFMSGVSRNDRLSDTESECSVPDLLSRDQIDELDRGNVIRTEQPSEQMTIDQRFSNMNKQISELTGLVLALTDKLSSNIGEGNNQNTASDKTCARSDNQNDILCFLVKIKETVTTYLRGVVLSSRFSSFRSWRRTKKKCFQFQNQTLLYFAGLVCRSNYQFEHFLVFC